MLQLKDPLCHNEEPGTARSIEQSLKRQVLGPADVQEEGLIQGPAYARIYGSWGPAQNLSSHAVKESGQDLNFRAACLLSDF